MKKLMTLLLILGVLVTIAAPATSGIASSSPMTAQQSEATVGAGPWACVGVMFFSGVGLIAAGSVPVLGWAAAFGAIATAGAAIAAACG